MSKTAVIVPCYNEARRLRVDVFSEFLLANADTDIYFIDDGSTDGTADMLNQLSLLFPAQAFIIQLSANRGKAVAVRTGFERTAATRLYTFIGYLDADLSTSLQEFGNLYTALRKNNADYIFGSRIKMLGTNIQRSFYRHLCGRLVATVIDLKLKLGIYDTQCGAKWFRTELVERIVDLPFETRWLFDIEIFMRINRMFPMPAGIEAPLKEWKDAGGSKITTLDLIAIFKEIRILYRLEKKRGS